MYVASDLNLILTNRDNIISRYAKVCSTVQNIDVLFLLSNVYAFPIFRRRIYFVSPGSVFIKLIKDIES